MPAMFRSSVVDLTPMTDLPHTHEREIIRSWNAGAGAALMRIWRWSFIGACLGLSGCVLGYGPCLFQQPVKINLTGRVHFRDYPTANGVDNVPVLVLDR